MEQDAVPQDAVTQERRRVVQHDDVEQRARHDAPQPAGEMPYHRAAIGAGRVLVEQDADIEIAVAPMPLAGAAAEEERKAHLGKLTDGAGQTVRR